MLRLFVFDVTVSEVLKELLIKCLNSIEMRRMLHYEGEVRCFGLISKT